jgi:hypothetical protein
MRRPSLETDLLLDVALCLEIVLLAWVLLQMPWNPQIQPLPPIFPTR